MDGSECSFRALDVGIDLAERLDTDLHCVHVTDTRDETVEEMLARARSTLDGADCRDDPEVITERGGLDGRGSVGRLVVQLVEEGRYDHVVMGHHGRGTVGRAILGSATETVMDETAVPVTIVP